MQLCGDVLRCTSGSKRIAHCSAVCRSANPLIGNSGQILGQCGTAPSANSGVIAHPWTRVGWLDAEPTQHGQHGGCAFRVARSCRRAAPGRTGIACTCSASAVRLAQMCSVLGTVAGVMHLVADDLVASRGPGSGRSRFSVPGFAPAGTSRPSTRRRRDRWQCAWSAGAMSAAASGSSPAVHLTMRAQHAMEAGPPLAM